MSEYVLINQRIKQKRSNNPYEIIKEAIEGNTAYNRYLEEYTDTVNPPADKEMFVYKEERDDSTEVDLFEMASVIKSAKSEAYDEFATKLFQLIERRTVNCVHDFALDELYNIAEDIKRCKEMLAEGLKSL